LHTDCLAEAFAEGVESEEQAKSLRLLKCDEMHGYSFGDPLSVDNVEAFLRPRTPAGKSNAATCVCAHLFAGFEPTLQR
jgi:predicted signal transduction protein with EAL and GGDEF domain